MINIDERVILDVSLLSPASQSFLSGLIDEGSLKFILTQQMDEFLSKPTDGLRDLFALWDIVSLDFPTEQLSETTDFFAKKVSLGRTIKSFPEPIRKMLLPPIRAWLSKDESIAGYIADEMSLALGEGCPILCISASKWKIVELFEKIGARVAKVVPAHFYEKSTFLRTNDFRKQLAASILGAAFVYALAGPIGGLGTLGASAVKIVIVDP